MRPWAVRWESVLQKSLFADEAGTFSRIVLEGLLRGDIASRYTAYNVGAQGGWLTRNEIRELEDLNPIEGGDVPLEPLNMLPAGEREQTQQQSPRQPPRRQVEGEQDDADAVAPAMPAVEAVTEECPESAVSMVAVLDPLLRDAAARIAARECRPIATRAVKAKGDTRRWAAWLDEFYSGHKQNCIDVLTPAATAWAALEQPAVDVTALAGLCCELSATLKSDPTALPAEEDRAGQLLTLFHATWSQNA
jgi:hypothetical protein